MHRGCHHGNKDPFVCCRGGLLSEKNRQRMLAGQKWVIKQVLNYYFLNIKMPVVTHCRLAQTAERGCRSTSKHSVCRWWIRPLFLSPFFFFYKKSITSAALPRWVLLLFFSREEAACCHNTGVQQNPPSLTKQAPMCLIRADEPLVPVRSLGCLVDHRYCPLHSKCTFSWQTCSVYSTSDVFFSFFSHCLAQDNCS